MHNPPVTFLCFVNDIFYEFFLTVHYISSVISDCKNHPTRTWIVSFIMWVIFFIIWSYLALMTHIFLKLCLGLQYEMIFLIEFDLFACIITFSLDSFFF